MARTFPSKIGKVSNEVGKVFRLFKKLPDDFQVWFSVGEKRGRPHCFLLWQERFGFLVHIADATQPFAKTALEARLFHDVNSTTVAELGSVECAVLEGFSDGLRRDLEADFPLRKLVVFPSVEHQTIEAISLQRGDIGVRFLGLAKLAPDSLPDFLREMAATELPEPSLVELRRSFNPETAVPESFSPLRVRERNTSATLTAGLLDLDQEWCMKHDLHLPEEAESLVEGYVPQRNQLVTGVAGSGKSLVLLYRSLLNARLNPEAKVLVLTHNRPLNFELQRRAESLGGMPRNVECLTFFQWAHRELQRIGRWDYPDGSIIFPAQTEDRLGKLLHGEETRLTVAFLADEIAWLKDHNIRQKDEYLGIDRTGRGSALREKGREEVWSYFRSYQKELGRDEKIDWHGIALRFHDAVSEGVLGFPTHDCILIDEAQFFAKAWFDVVNAALKPGGQLFLAADPTQGFLRRRQSWLASGIDVRGRTTRLRQAYRNSRRILKFAAAFFEANAAEGEGLDELNVPDAEQIAAIPVEGNWPEVVHCPSDQDVTLRVVNEVGALADSGAAPGDVLILYAGSGSMAGLESQLGATLGGVHRVHEAGRGKRPAVAFCQVARLNAATGMEARRVFLFGMEKLIESASASGVSAEELGERQRDCTRQLYMAFTRAGQQLVIVTRSSKLASRLQGLIEPSTEGQALH